jgi:hypothetical protein
VLCVSGAASAATAASAAVLRGSGAAVVVLRASGGASVAVVAAGMNWLTQMAGNREYTEVQQAEGADKVTRCQRVKKKKQMKMTMMMIGDGNGERNGDEERG